MRDEVARALAARALEVAKNAKAQQGPKGEKGDPGQIIVQPNKGDKGDTGPMGPQGIPGKSITGPKGDKGDKGDPGQKGDKGDKGDTGEKGDKGERGERGFQGLKGLDGAKGDIGPMPKHEKKGLMVRFEKEPGTWGEWIIMPTSGGGGGRDDKLTDRQAELVALAEFYKTRGSNANKYIKTDGTTLTWDTLDGSDINLSSPPPIGNTTPATGTFTTITGQTEVLRGTGQNLVLQSNTFNTTWVSTSSTVATTVATTDPTGGSNAWIITSTSGGGASGVQQTFSNANAVYTFSVYAKAGTSTFLRIYLSTTSGFAYFNLSNGTIGTVQANATASITSAGNGWYRCSVTSTYNGPLGIRLADADNTTAATNGTYFYVYGAQVEVGSVTNTYIPTTTTAVYGTPTLSFSGVSTIGLQSDGSLYVSPAGTGAIQAQATTSTTAGGNARGANAVDWQTSRSGATRVASALTSVVAGGDNNGATATNSVVSGGTNNVASGAQSFIGSGNGNAVSSPYANVVGGFGNTGAGYYNFIGAGQANSGTAQAVVTTQATSTITSGSTAVTLSGSNANIRVGQLITGTPIATNTYVAAISGTSLTLSQNATSSSNATLSFFTPHGVVVGGGNNQATGSYSFIGGGGDAGTSANRNVASGDWSFVGGGLDNQATGIGAFVGGGGTTTGAASGNLASGTTSTICGGANNTASGTQSFIGGGLTNIASAAYSSVLGGRNGTVRAIQGNMTFPACTTPIANTSGVTQSSLLLLGRETTDATPTVLTSNASAAGTTNQVILPNNSAYYFTGEIVSGVTGGGNSKGWEISGLIKRGANAAATTLVGSTVTSLYADAGAATWTIALAADTTNGGLRVTFTGQAGTTIRTVCQIRTTEMTF